MLDFAAPIGIDNDLPRLVVGGLLSKREGSSKNRRTDQ
jgi:hypothetical protein